MGKNVGKKQPEKVRIGLSFEKAVKKIVKTADAKIKAKQKQK